MELGLPELILRVLGPEHPEQKTCIRAWSQLPGANTLAVSAAPFRATVRLNFAGNGGCHALKLQWCGNMCALGFLHSDFSHIAIVHGIMAL